MYSTNTIKQTLRFVLDLFYFAPQLVGNYRNPARLKSLSLGTQTLAFVSEISFLLYSVGARLPPQSVLPSVVCTVLEGFCIRAEVSGGMRQYLA